MNDQKLLLVGIGNYGLEYNETRHNVGFSIIDSIVEKYKLNDHFAKFKAQMWQMNVGNHKIILAKPQTYVNNSGISVMEIKRFYKIFIDNIFVFHDDLDLAVEKVKIKQGGGDGGHNGLKSIDEFVGKNYYRIRMGIGRPEYKSMVSDYVLEKFTPIQKVIIDDNIKKISGNLELLLQKRFDIFFNKAFTDDKT